MSAVENIDEIIKKQEKIMEELAIGGEDKKAPEGSHEPISEIKTDLEESFDDDTKSLEFNMNIKDMENKIREGPNTFHKEIKDLSEIRMGGKKEKFKEEESSLDLAMADCIKMATRMIENSNILMPAIIDPLAYYEMKVKSQLFDELFPSVNIGTVTNVLSKITGEDTLDQTLGEMSIKNICKDEKLLSMKTYIDNQRLQEANRDLLLKFNDVIPGDLLRTLEEQKAKIEGMSENLRKTLAMNEKLLSRAQSPATIQQPVKPTTLSYLVQEQRSQLISQPQTSQSPFMTASQKALGQITAQSKRQEPTFSLSRYETDALRSKTFKPQ